MCRDSAIGNDVHNTEQVDNCSYTNSNVTFFVADLSNRTSLNSFYYPDVVSYGNTNTFDLFQSIVYIKIAERVVP